MTLAQLHNLRLVKRSLEREEQLGAQTRREGKECHFFQRGDAWGRGALHSDAVL